MRSDNDHISVILNIIYHYGVFRMPNAFSLKVLLSSRSLLPISNLNLSFPWKNKGSVIICTGLSYFSLKTNATLGIFLTSFLSFTYRQFLMGSYLQLFSYTSPNSHPRSFSSFSVTILVMIWLVIRSLRLLME